MGHVTSALHPGGYLSRPPLWAFTLVILKCKGVEGTGLSQEVLDLDVQWTE